MKQPIVNPNVSFTGEGFKGEKLLSVLSVVLTIVSAGMLIHLTFLQKKQTRLQLAKLQVKDENKNKT